VGTSADRSAGRGGDWTPLKYATTSYVRGIGLPNSSARAGRVLARHLPILGGVGGAGASAHAGRTGIQRLGQLVSGLVTSGLEETLAAIGLTSLVGEDRFTILDALVTFVAGGGDDLDAQAARDAACDVLDEIFGDADTWAQLMHTEVTSDELVVLLEQFLALYVYNRVPVVAERLSNLTDPAAARRADQEMRQIIGDLVVIHLPADPFALDWSGGAGRAIADDAIESAYRAIRGLETEI
jgi:hypothetical protein